MCKPFTFITDHLHLCWKHYRIILKNEAFCCKKGLIIELQTKLRSFTRKCQHFWTGYFRNTPINLLVYHLKLKSNPEKEFKNEKDYLVKEKDLGWERWVLRSLSPPPKPLTWVDEHNEEAVDIFNFLFPSLFLSKTALSFISNLQRSLEIIALVFVKISPQDDLERENVKERQRRRQY